VGVIVALLVAGGLLVRSVMVGSARDVADAFEVPDDDPPAIDAPGARAPGVTS
jgi:hypothetical protein